MLYRTPLDIANRACQFTGVMRIGLEGFNEDSKQASEINDVYDNLRRAELRRNLWRCSIRHVVLRPIDDTSMLVRPVMWMSGTTYAYGALVSDVSGLSWMSKISNNLGRGPAYDADAWELYTGPLMAQPYDSTTTYFAGEVVYTYTGNGSYKVYMSLVDSNADDPATATDYDATVTYRLGQVVTSVAIPYQSLISLNMGNTPVSSPTAWSTTLTNGSGSVKWLELSAYLEEMLFAYPLGTGPATSGTTRNVFRLPASYLRKAPQDPKAGSHSDIGAPTNSDYDDWLYEADYIISSSTLIVLRFGADLADVSRMDPMFCEGLAARIAIATCVSCTGSGEKLSNIEAQYKLFMSEARVTNGIEQGPIEQPIDDWLSCRV